MREPQNKHFFGVIERTYAARKVNRTPNFQDVFVDYTKGKSCTGKTYSFIRFFYLLVEEGLVSEETINSKFYIIEETLNLLT